MRIDIVTTVNWELPEGLKEEYLEYLGKETPTLSNFYDFLEDNLYLDTIAEEGAEESSGITIDYLDYEEFKNTLND